MVLVPPPGGYPPQPQATQQPVPGRQYAGFGIRLVAYLIDGLIRYENLMDDWWDVDDKSGMVRGQRTGTRIGIGSIFQQQSRFFGIVRGPHESRRAGVIPDVGIRATFE